MNDYLQSIIRRAHREHPKTLLRELNRIYYNRFYSDADGFYIEGTNIMDEDWDNLIILDACRYDLFEEVMTLTGTLEKQTSLGSWTAEFLKANFDNEEFMDTVYVTANPQLYRNRVQYGEINPMFFEEIQVWRDDTAWIEFDNVGTVLPAEMSDQVIEAAVEFPNKRVIAHYLQPHYPFITNDTEFDKYKPEKGTADMWKRVFIGEIDVSDSELRNAYRTNLVEVMPHIERVLNDLSGKTVVTSDHGNMIGERAWPIPIKEYGHPMGLYMDALVTVPWLVVESEARKQITTGDEHREVTESDTELAEERLSQLGYK